MKLDVNSENNAIHHFLNVCREAVNKKSVNASLNLAYLRSGILQFVEYQRESGEKMMLPYREASSSLERSRLFEISHDEYREMHVAIHESLGLVGEQPGDEELGQYQPAVEDLVSKVPFPPRLPFPHVYIGISSPVVLAGRMLLCGFLLNQHGQAWELSIDSSREIPIVMPLTTACSNYPNAQDKSVGIWRSRTAGQYSPAAFLMYEIVQAIIGFQNLKVEVPDLLTKLLAKKNRVPGFPKVVPPPFYRIPLTDQIERVKLQIQRREISKSSSFSYVHDVRGHWMTRIVKGTTPIDPKVLKRLVKREYLIWTDRSKIPKEYYNLLSKRGVYVNSDEWVAILRSWRSDFLRPKNRPDLPYVPATRVME